jgi:hypothetical protein
MGKLLDALETHEYSDAEFKIAGKTIPVKVKIFSDVNFQAELEALRIGNEQENAARLASYFLDPETLTQCFTAEILLSGRVKNPDVKRLVQFFVKVNSGIEGN